MKAHEAKRAVEATLERVYTASGNRFQSVKFKWYGKTAAVTRVGSETTIFFPAIDDAENVSPALFNRLIGCALHELGHVWVTDDHPWNRAVQHYGAFVGRLINGLEDPRIEQWVIDSGFAPNARTQFESLTRWLCEDWEQNPEDLINIPFLLAIEGRRMNGYSIGVRDIVDETPWADAIRDALQKAHHARSTAEIVEIAIELYGKLPRQNEEKKPEQKHEEPQDSEQGGKEERGDEQKEKKGKPAKPMDVEPGDKLADELKGMSPDVNLPLFGSFDIQNLEFI